MLDTVFIYSCGDIMKKELPAKYYLAHFRELIEFVTSKCMHLLEPKHSEFISKINQLDEQSQCMLARVYSRKPYLVQAQSLNYEEITSPHQAIYTLKKAGILFEPNEQHYSQLLAHLTKPSLVELLSNYSEQISFKKSAAKGALVEIAREFFKACPQELAPLYSQYVINNRSDYYEYFEFLFAGKLSSGDVNHQNRFVMRDLGLTATREGHSESLSRFETLDEAQSNYLLNRYRLAFKNITDESDYVALASQVLVQAAHGAIAVVLKNKLLVRLYRQLKTVDSELAFSLLEGCVDDSEAQEIQIREQYRLGNKEWVKARLEAIIENPLTDDLLYFADDFLMRKFNKKTRSRLSAMLADTQCVLEIDELYRGEVEQGVNDYYTRQGMQVFNTENTLWQSLFGLVFWHELFVESPYPPCNEFDIYPQVLRLGNFYEAQQTQINERLAQCKTSQALLNLVCKNAAQYFDQPNGLFRWRSNLLEPLEALILNSPLEALIAHLTAMSKHYLQLKDGYPDLMVINNGQVHFEEVKAPGDKLRRNQLTTIDNLKNVGFTVHIAAVKWFVDPNRVYSVVDIETTGGLKGGNRITEIGIVKVQHGKVIDTWTTLINPQRHIPGFITSLTGISDSMVYNAPVFADIAKPLLDKLSGSIFVAHNVNFDYGFIKKECEMAGHFFKMPKMCTVVESRKAFKGLKSYSLGNLSAHFNLNLTSHHRALADATATAELLLLIQNSETLTQ
ncbi:DNA polymerase III subunit epsilon [Pseudoalteromonas distincta]|uniref:Exonuclease domain-containing protein n=2 Tax=Gammaproteobacteria TaxID=1236 RepID=A0ABT9GDU1_9GAMM|nr:MULTISPECIES: exonuclease domain-containing protein [Pseudoalteromonas distincta group]KHM44630.1 DNA polymerase III subunit epsilon [Pseudoalteromonas elyakovii]KID40267.1 DNA polymerase III subunit epsilon [Pseudoalteromonas distincta]MDP4484035.1 exonuclease domain-containing protein [Pseudoalteromonas elyakovii]